MYAYVMREFLLILRLMSGSVVDALILEAPYTRMNEAAAVSLPASVRPQHTDCRPSSMFTV